MIVEAGVACSVFLKLSTDEGLIGLGDCTLESKEHTVLGALQDVSPLVLGRDPRQIERLWQELYRRSPWQGVGLFTAMSGLEQAMWDITGKAYGQPVYRLLGGECRDRLRLYTWPQPAGDSPAGYAEGALEAVSRGYTALKTDPFGELFFTATPGQIEATVGKV